MEKEAARAGKGGQDDSGTGMDREQERSAVLLERWRKEVFDSLLRNKRYELLVKSNLASYTKDLNALKLELKQTSTDATLAKNKVTLLENEAKLREESLSKGQEVVNRVNRQNMALREENLVLKQQLKGLTLQTEAVMAAHLKQLQGQEQII